MSKLTAGKKAFTKEQWVEKRVAEGFSIEYAEKEYDGLVDQEIKEAQDPSVPTKADLMVMIEEAYQKNPDKKKLYTPDFKMSDQYVSLKKEVARIKSTQPYDEKRAQEILSEMLDVQFNGTLSKDGLQMEIDKTLEMPIKTILAERKKYKKIIKDCENKIDNFDMTGFKAEAEVLDKKYKDQTKGKAGAVKASYYEEYLKELEKLEFEKVKNPLNVLAIKRWEAKQFFLVFDARVKYYINANSDLIKDEIENAKREEIRGSLVDLVELIEEV